VHIKTAKREALAAPIAGLAQGAFGYQCGMEDILGRQERFCRFAHKKTRTP
jgi:hypothetical protein